MKINQLRYFLKIVEAGSLSRAAESLGVAQPALSQHVANLEQSLDVALLKRSPRGVACTPAGELLYEHARTIVRQIARAESAVRHIGQSPQGEVAVVIAATVAPILAAPFAIAVAERLPDVSVQIKEGMSIDLARLVESGRADLALVPRGLLPGGVDSEQAFTEEFVFGGRKGLDGDSDEPIDFADACQFPLVLPTRPHYVRNTLEQVAFDSGVSLNVRAEQNSTRLLRRFIGSGYGYSILPENSFVEDLERDLVFTRKITQPEISRALHIISPRPVPRDRVVAGVKSVLRELIVEQWRAGHLRGDLKIAAE